MMPWIVNLNWFFRSVLPVSWNDWLSEKMGVSSSMDQFKGRGSWWAAGKKTE